MNTLAMHPHRRRLDRATIGRLLAALVASVWLYHGLVNKLLHGSPRHLTIVQSVPGLAGVTGEAILMLVGVAEVFIAVWILSNAWPRTCAAVQTAALLAMNVAELAFARDHLLWPAMLLPANLVFLTLAWAAAELRRDVTPAKSFNPLFLLRRHPFPVVAHFDDSLVLTYALPASVLEPLLPPGLTLDTHNGFGFLAVAIVQTRRLRPALLPPICGKDFVLTGYRVFVKFKTPDGRTLRGLRILRSDADRALMVAGGNLLTHYNYRKCDATVAASRDALDVAIRTPDGAADVDVTADLARGGNLPPGSPFRTPHDARRFAGPLPWTFDYEPETNSIVAIKGVRQNWSPRLVNVDVRRLTFLSDKEGFRGVTPILASAFHVRDIGYRWLRGVRHRLTPSPFQGVLQIARFNWPQYLTGSIVIAASLVIVATLSLPRGLATTVVIGAAAAFYWLIASLVASHIVYDRSPLRRWQWIADALGFMPRTWVNLHAGLDESSPAIRAMFPNSTGRIFDFFDPAMMTERSIRRARQLARNVTKPEKANFRRVPLADGSTDAALLLFSAHELRDRRSRVALLAEIRRALAPAGRIILAEHLRDLANFAAFGPGFTHFFSRREWLATFAAAGLAMEREFRITPFIAVFVLRRIES
jgi:SAM-dependent methyltransferase